MWWSNQKNYICGESWRQCWKRAGVWRRSLIWAVISNWQCLSSQSMMAISFAWRQGQGAFDWQVLLLLMLEDYRLDYALPFHMIRDYSSACGSFRISTKRGSLVLNNIMNVLWKKNWKPFYESRKKSKLKCIWEYQNINITHESKVCGVKLFCHNI